jgi:hypothetical protein
MHGLEQKSAAIGREQRRRVESAATARSYYATMNCGMRKQSCRGGAKGRTTYAIGERSSPKMSGGGGRRPSV